MVRFLISILLSVGVSVAATLLLRAALNPAAADTDGEGEPRRTPSSISPTTVVVFVPIIAGNGRFGGKKDRDR